MLKSLYEEFRRLEGQPVKIYTDDGKTHTGRVLNVYEDGVRIIDDCGRLILIEFRRIDSVVEPQMDLERCCREHEHEHEHECEEEEEDFEEDFD